MPPDLPDLTAARRVLCVQPHYDDNDLGAGGTIAALADRGAEIVYLTATDDLVGVRDATLGEAEARARLRADQARAGAEIGVHRQLWLDLPDAGPYDYYALRNGIIRHVRALRPDWILSVDPWLGFEAHSDHLRVGRAVAEAALLQRFPRLRIDPEVDAAYEPYEVTALAFYFTTRPNLRVDVGATRERRQRAIAAYTTQLGPDEIRGLQAGLAWLERRWAENEPFEYAEPLLVLRPGQLHVNLLPELV